MALSYAKDPRTIILAVTPANQDVVTSDALQIANSVDPSGRRTIGVLTKIDLMDKGTNAIKTLMGEEFKLRLGYVGVKNRSQDDINNNRSVEEALACEKEFFQNSKTYNTLPPDSLGIPALVNKLTQILFKQIRTFLPEIKDEISNHTRLVNQQLQTLGTGVPTDVAGRSQVVWSLVSEYIQMYNNTLRGKFDKKYHLYFKKKKDSVGSNIRQLFNELLLEELESDITKDVSDKEIDDVICMHEGDSLPGFPSSDTFEFLIRPRIEELRDPVIECLDAVTQFLQNLSHTLVKKVFARFPCMADEVSDLCGSVIAREKEKTKTIIEYIVEAETNYLFTNDLKYLTDHASVVAETKEDEHNEPEGNPTETILSAIEKIKRNKNKFKVDKKTAGKLRYSHKFIEEIRKRLQAYYVIVVRNVRDEVPKLIGHFLVNELRDKVQFEIINELTGPDKLKTLLSEPEGISERRKYLTQQLNVLKKAGSVLLKDPEIVTVDLDDGSDVEDVDDEQGTDKLIQT